MLKYNNLDPVSRAKADKSIGLLTRLEASDPLSWVASEMQQDIPQVARFMVLQLIRRHTMDFFVPHYFHKKTQIEPTLDLDKAESEAQAAFKRLMEIGGDPADILHITRSATYNAVFRVLDMIDSQVDYDNRDGPSWALLELNADGKLTGRSIDELSGNLSDVFAADEGLS